MGSLGLVLLRARHGRGHRRQELERGDTGVLLRSVLLPVLRSQVDRMTSIREFFKSLRIAWLAGRAEFHRRQWQAKRRRQLPDYF
jgi:hypothetical protein